MDSETFIRCPQCGFRQGGGDISCEQCGRVLERETDNLELPGMSIEDIEAMWGESISPDDTPGMSIRESTQGGSSTSGVMVNQKRLGEVGQSLDPPGEYDLLKLLGSGGMGLVYSARQNSINRIIALKMIKPDVADDPARREKFLSEAAVTGELDHPNIVPIHDLGSSESGQLFYAMKEVRGTSWREVIDGNTRDENLEILLRVADAVAFAHSRNVIHRDLKPANVMLGEFGEVLVMDWGLAASTEDGGKAETLRGRITTVGTPAYMSPEMVGGHGEDIGPRSDQYLLGGILYEIVTGKQPHAGESPLECLAKASRNVIEETDETGELLEIARRAMAADPADRYATVKTFQGAIRQYQQHEESLTLTERAWEQLERARDSGDYDDYSRAVFGFEEALELWPNNAEAEDGHRDGALAHARCAQQNGDLDLAASLLNDEEPEHQDLLRNVERERQARAVRGRRHRIFKYGSVALAGLIFVILTVSFFWIRAERARAVSERRKAETALRSAERENYFNGIALAQNNIEKNDYEHARAILEDLSAESAAPYRGWEWGRLMHLCNLDLLTLHAHSDRVSAVDFGPEGRRLLTGSWDKSVKVWDLTTGREITTFEGHRGGRATFSRRINSACFSPDGQWALTTAQGDRPRIWNVTSGELVRALEGPAAWGSFGPSGERILTAHGSNKATIWEARTGRKVSTFTGPSNMIRWPTFHPEGDRIGTVGQPGSTASIWDAQTGDEIVEFDGHSEPVVFLAFSPEGTKVATASRQGVTKMWDTGTGEELLTVRGGHPAFSPDGKSLATACSDAMGRVWDVKSGELLLELEGHEASVNFVLFGPKGERLLTCSDDSTARVWEAKSGEEIIRFDNHDGPVASAIMSPDGNWALTAGNWKDGTARVWGAETGEEILKFDGLRGIVKSVAFSPDAETVVVADGRHALTMWKVPSGEVAQRFQGYSEMVVDAAFSPNGERLVAASRDGLVKIWDVAGGTELLSFRVGAGEHLRRRRVRQVRFNADGDRILVGSPASVQVRDAQTGTKIMDLEGRRGQIKEPAFGPDGRRIISAGGRDGTATIWNAVTGERVRTLDGEGRWISRARFGPGGERVVTGHPAFGVAIWDVGSGRKIRELTGEGEALSPYMPAFGPEGDKLVAACRDDALRVWDVGTGEELLVLEGHSGLISAVQFSPDGRFLVSGSDDDTAKVWSATRRRDVRVLGSPQNTATPSMWVGRASFGPDSRRVVVGYQEGVARIWDARTADQIRTLRGHSSLVCAADFSPDGQRVVTASWDRTSRIWEAETGEPLLRLSGHTDRVYGAVFAPTGQVAGTVSRDGSVRIWNAHTGELKAVLDRGSSKVTSLAFSPDGLRLVAGSGGHTARIWNIGGAAPPVTLRGHDWHVIGVDFGPGGKRVATASWDETARVWDAETGEQMLRLEGHAGRVYSVAFSPDGRRIVTAGRDGTAKIWDAKTGKELLSLDGQPVSSASFSPDGKSVLSLFRTGRAVVYPALDWSKTTEELSDEKRQRWMGRWGRE